MNDRLIDHAVEEPNINGLVIAEMDLSTLTAHEVGLAAETAKIEAELEFDDSRPEEWRKRATKALGVKRFMLQRVRDAMRRKRKKAPTEVSTEAQAAVKLAKYETHIAKTEARKTEAGKAAEATRLKQASVAERHSIYRAFYDSAKALLPTDTFAKVSDHAIRVCGGTIDGEIKSLAPKAPQ